MSPLSRADALLQGSKFYFTGISCKNRHVAKRLTSTRACYECSRVRGKAWHERTGRTTSKYRHLLSKYGLTKEAAERLLHEQAGKCSICGTCVSLTSTAYASQAVVDHCHETGQVRSFLCHPCNRGIGVFNENPEALSRAAAYLRGHKPVKERP